MTTPLGHGLGRPNAFCTYATLRWADDFCTAIETPDWYQNGFSGSIVQWAFPPGEPWTFPTPEDRADSESFPRSDLERCQYYDDGNTPVDFGGPDLSVVELARHDFAALQLGVVEEIATWFRADALNEDGDVIFTATSYPPGVNPAPFPLEHPIPGFPELNMRWLLVREGHGTEIVPPLPPLGTVFAPNAPGPERLIQWNDLRFDYESRYTQRMRWLVDGPAYVRLFCQATGLFMGENPAWRLRLVGRLRGVAVASGQTRAALHFARGMLAVR